MKAFFLSPSCFSSKFSGNGPLCSYLKSLGKLKFDAFVVPIG